jgi:F0F1-type ATP synthase membrane subunit a
MLRLNGAVFVQAHAVLAYGAFTLAFVTACSLHYTRIVKNEFYGYPQEWFPSVSAVLGDWAPERPIFQIGMALVATPRVINIFILWLNLRRKGSLWPDVVGFCGFGRILSSWVWMFVTSTDNHDVHDVGMITFLVLTVPWMVGNILLTPPAQRQAKRRRQIIMGAYFGCILAMIPLYIQHKVQRKAGAYSRYAYFEWGLIVFDILYDCVSIAELSQWEVVIARKGEISGYARLL